MRETGSLNPNGTVRVSTTNVKRSEDARRVARATSARRTSAARNEGASRLTPFVHSLQIAVCSNDATIRHYPDDFFGGVSGFGYRHALRFLLSLPDASRGQGL